jgi:formimidoylglutamate deiminase
MINEAQTCGRAAMGLRSKSLVIGEAFDVVVYNARSPRLSTSTKGNLLSVLLYHGNSSLALGTIVDGKWIVKNQHHVVFESIRENFMKAMKGIAI